MPRTGGVILCKGEDEAVIQAIIQEDPFCHEKLAEYTLTHFQPSKMAEGFEKFI